MELLLGVVMDQTKPSGNGQRAWPVPKLDEALDLDKQVPNLVRRPRYLLSGLPNVSSLSGTPSTYEIKLVLRLGQPLVISQSPIVMDEFVWALSTFVACLAPELVIGV